MSVLSLRDFVSQSADQQQGSEFFELESEHILQVNLAGDVRMRMGSMIAYVGDIAFEREGILQGGVGQFLKKAVSGEGDLFSVAKGRGRLYLADAGKRVTLIRLQGESLVVNGDSLLAIQPGVKHEVNFMRKVSAITSGGLANVTLSGSGQIALTTHRRPLALGVARGQPVYTDPQATVAWSSTLTPDFKTDIQLKTLLGRGSGESFQMKFEGDGFVLVQPYEDSIATTQGG